MENGVRQRPRRSVIVLASVAIAVVAVIVTISYRVSGEPLPWAQGGTENSSPTADSRPYQPDPEADAQLVESFGCEDCRTPVHIVPGLEHQGDAARLIITNADRGKSSFGEDRQVAVYLVRNKDDQLIAHNMAGEATGSVLPTELDFDDIWAKDDTGNVYLLTEADGAPERQRVAWLNQENLASVQYFSTFGISTAWQDSLDIEDIDGDGIFEVGANAGVRQNPPKRMDARLYYKFDGASGQFKAWKCTDTATGTPDDEHLYTMREAPCTDYGYQEEVPWTY
ncbi:MAG: hypothetical protein M0026_19715 [Nocardiopsaceae bacterium]|nr:hypothetical protein [Nocardiopsaceae bacterium]